MTVTPPWQGAFKPHGTLVIASHNANKVREMAELIAPFSMTVISSASLGLPEPEETGSTFAENARLKAVFAAQASGMPALADDSGLEVVALSGAPGIYSARWAGENKDFVLAMKRIEHELTAKRVAPTGAAARFVCVLSLALPEGETVEFEGTIEGTLAFPPRGDRGFGYDPIFIPRGEIRSFAEMDIDEKHAISHRAVAVAKLSQFVAGLRMEVV